MSLQGPRRPKGSAPSIPCPCPCHVASPGCQRAPAQASACSSPPPLLAPVLLLPAHRKRFPQKAARPLPKPDCLTCQHSHTLHVTALHVQDTYCQLTYYLMFFKPVSSSPLPPLAPKQGIIVRNFDLVAAVSLASQN